MSKLGTVFSTALVWMEEGTPPASGLPLPGVPLLCSVHLEGANAGFAGLKDLYGLFLDFS